MFYLFASALLSFSVAAWLKERVLYVIFVWAYVQNFVLAWMYTSGWVGRDLCQALLLVKEFMLLWLFVHYLPELKQFASGSLRLPIQLLVCFTAWCVVRYAIAVVFQGEGLFSNLFNLRLVCFPLQILSVAIGVTRQRRDFAIRFVRQMAYVVPILAFIGIFLYLPIGTSFWHDHVDFARYTFDVKEQSRDLNSAEIGDVQAAAEGVVGNGLAREEFSFLSPFRAMGTIGDSVGFGHLLAFPVLLLAFCLRRSWKTQLMLFVTVIALLFSFTRSAWIFVVTASMFVLLYKKRYRLVLSLIAIPLITLLLWAPLASWFSSSLDFVSSSTPDEHVNGIMWFYRQGIWDLSYSLGHDQSGPIPEGGYGILLIRFGLPAVVSIVWFWFALYRALRRSEFRGMPLFLVSEAMLLVLFLTMNFSAYPFSFIPYLIPWFVVGICLVFADQPARVQGVSRRTCGSLTSEGF